MRKRAENMQAEQQAARRAMLKALPSAVIQKRKKVRIVNGKKEVQYANPVWLERAVKGEVLLLKRMIEAGQNINERDRVGPCAPCCCSPLRPTAACSVSPERLQCIDTCGGAWASRGRALVAERRRSRQRSGSGESVLGWARQFQLAQCLSDSHGALGSTGTPR